MQVLRHWRYWDGKNTLFFPLGNNENYTFININFLTFRPDLQSCKEGGKKHISGMFKNNKNRGGAFLYNGTIKLLFQILMFIQIFGKGL